MSPPNQRKPYEGHSNTSDFPLPDDEPAYPIDQVHGKIAVMHEEIVARMLSDSAVALPSGTKTTGESINRAISLLSRISGYAAMACAIGAIVYFLI